MAKGEEIMTTIRTATKEESDYFASLEEKETLDEKNRYMNQYDGSYEASRGDYEGAILARDEYNSGRIS